LGINFLSQCITFLYTIILQSINSSVHLMFPESLWIINVLYVCASALISPGTATYQGTHSHFYPLCTQMHYRNMCVLHPSGTSSDTFQPELVFKILISICETLLEYGRNLIKLSSILKLLNALNSYHFGKSSENRYRGSFLTFLISIFSNLCANVRSTSRPFMKNLKN